MLAAALVSAVHGARVRPIQMIGNLLSGLAAPLPDPIDYTALRGLPKSFGQEAGGYAMSGAVPEKSKDGWSIATFGGGCFWGTELHFQRIDGVIATCVGYTTRASDLGSVSPTRDFRSFSDIMPHDLFARQVS